MTIAATPLTSFEVELDSRSSVTQGDLDTIREGIKNMLFVSWSVEQTLDGTNVRFTGYIDEAQEYQAQGHQKFVDDIFATLKTLPVLK